MPEQNRRRDSASSVLQVLLLEGLEGVGRVTTRRILEQFDDLGDLARYPREQVLNRLKGVANAGDLVDTLTNHETMEAAQENTSKRIAAWNERKIGVRTFMDPNWPGWLNDLPNPHRPNALYTYGDGTLLERPGVALVARGAVEEGPFETAQQLIRMVNDRGIRAVFGLSTGFDVVGIKLSLDKEVAPVLVASCGLARISPSMRPHASSTVQAGGLLVSSLPMDHGPFEHDKREGALVQTALARAVVFVDTEPGQFEWTALEWSLSAGMSVFAISERPLPERVHVIKDSVDMEWVVAAVEHVADRAGGSGSARTGGSGSARTGGPGSARTGNSGSSRSGGSGSRRSS